jgi:phage portal protein BeeE
MASRMAEAMTGFLCEGNLRLAHDLDQVEALSADREALWARVGKAEFLTADEKRQAVGYGAVATP